MVSAESDIAILVPDALATLLASKQASKADSEATRYPSRKRY